MPFLGALLLLMLSVAGAEAATYSSTVSPERFSYPETRDIA